MRTLIPKAPNRAALLRRWHTKDPAEDGRFLVGVLTTGIYCLPSCRARKPKDENVRFFADEPAARGAGLRACKRCRPDRFYEGADPELDRLAQLVERVRARPEEVGGTAELARGLGVGSTKLTQLLRRHYHTTPAALLQRARLERAARGLLDSRRPVLEVALAAGFESSSAFHEGFARRFALSPGAYRRLPRALSFQLDLPPGHDPGALTSLFGRDEEGVNERAEGRRFAKGLELAGRPARLEIELGRERARVEVGGVRRPSRALLVAAHERALRVLGLASDPGPFLRRVRRTKGLSRLVRGYEGLRIPLTADAFEGLLWVVVGQQVNLAFASWCRARVIELCGTKVPGGLTAHPDAEAVARLDYADLTRRKFSRRKAEYLIDTARAIASGELALEALAALPVGRAEERLLARRGLGPWSVQYLLMRSFGFEDCVPVGDAGLTAALQRFFALEERPNARETLRLMEPFAPHRSLATFHLWRSLGDEA